MLSFVDLSIAVSGFQGPARPDGDWARRGAGNNYTRPGPGAGRARGPPRFPHNRGAGHGNAPRWSATSCSPTDLLRSTIGARGLNFWVRNGTRCASPAMVADQQGVFLFHKGFSRALRAAQCDVKFKGFKNHASVQNIIKKRRARPISNARLNALQHLHLHPINLVVYKGSYRKENSSWDGLPA